MPLKLPVSLRVIARGRTAQAQPPPDAREKHRPIVLDLW